MTFDAPVTVTGDPTFAFDLGGPSTATWYAGSGTTTLRFSHAVSGGSSGDRDTNGISWAENAIVLNGGTIAGTDNAETAVLTHAAQSNLADHKVDGRTTAVTPATVTDVVVTSTPMLMASGSSTADTYGFGETIVITVTVSEAVEVVGDPVFRFSLTNPGSAANNPQATYDRTRSIATTIVFTYTVQAGDMDNNGIWIGTHSQTFMLDANDRIRTASQQIDIDRSHPEKGTQGGHKVDGSLGAPTVPPDPTAPTLVSATATTLTIEWTHPGDGGSPLTRNFIEYRVEGTTDWTNWYRGETPTSVTRTVITNLAAATAYDVRVHSTNAIGNSQWVQSATAFSTLAGTASCPVPTFTGRRKIWTAVLTMGDFTEGATLSLRGYSSNPESGDGGGLDPATFTLGSRDYEVGRIALATAGASGLNFVAGQGQGEWWDSTVLALRLHVCNTNFDFSDSDYIYADEGSIVIESSHVWTTDLDWSGVTTRTVHLSLPLNRPATGAPVITGPATVGQELAVDVTGIEDEDGLHDIEYTYQWVRVDADGTSNEEDITDATADTYTLTDDDLGKKVKIEVSFSDDFGSDEQRTSAPTDTVTAVAMTTPGVTVSTTALTVTEEDTTGDSYTVVLDSQPTATVTVTVAGHAGTDVTPSPTSLTFTTTTWGTAQTVTVTAGDDADTANDAVTLTHSAASTDTGYEGISIDGVAVTVTDNDAAKGVTVSTTALTVTEEDTTGASYTVVLNSQPTANVTVTVAGHAGTDVTPSPTSLTFTSTTWGTAQTVTVTAGDDADTANDAVTLTHSAASTDTGYEGISIDGVAVTVTDNDAAKGVTVSTTALTVTEEDTTGDSYTVVLDSQPTATVTVTVAGHAGTDVTPSPTSLTFTTTNWGTAQTVTVTAGDDADAVNDSVALTHSAASTDTGYEGISIDGVAVTVTDNDDNNRPPGVTVSKTALTVTEEDTAGAGYTVVLDSEPTANVTVTVAGHAGTDVTPSPTSLTFTPMNWGTAQTVTVTAGADADTANESVSLTHSAASTDSDYQGITIAGVAVTVRDNDAANTPATGAPTITGTAQVGETLTAVTTGIMDADGLTSPTYTYQWIRVDGTEADIAGANSSTYTLGAADLGKTLKVRVTFDDDASHTEMLTSAATATVTATTVTTPGAPQNLSWAPGDGQVTLSWDAPSSDGGAAIIRYEYETDDSGTWIDAGTDRRVTVTGLTNGQPYTFAVRAVNAAGGGPAAAVTATPVTTPGAPQNLSWTPGDGQVTLSWDAPSSDGGAAITRYEYEIDDSGTWIDADLDLQETVPDLANGQPYTFAVRAMNAAGDGPAATVTATPVTTPGAPENLGWAPGDGQVTLSWDAPSSDGGAAIARYEYEIDDSGTWIDADLDLQETVPDLTNGQPYTFAVRAVNAAGGSPAAAVTATPATTPGAPQNLGWAPGDGQVTLSWDAPSSDGGAAITRYEYEIDASGTWIDAGLDLQETVPGLTNGQPYTFALRAVNAAGGGDAATVTATPVTTPGAPQNLSWVAGYEQVTLNWDAPSSDGGAAITRYEYAIDDNGTWIDTGADRQVTVSGLTNGQPYTFAVRAVNAVGGGDVATVTIVSADPLPQAWLARFGRAAADHVVEAVSDRWRGGPAASHLTIGGRQAGDLFDWTGLGGQAARDTADDRGDPVRTGTSSTRPFAPFGGAGTSVGGAAPGMTLSVNDMTRPPLGPGAVDRDAGAAPGGRRRAGRPCRTRRAVGRPRPARPAGADGSSRIADGQFVLVHRRAGGRRPGPDAGLARGVVGVGPHRDQPVQRRRRRVVARWRGRQRDARIRQPLGPVAGRGRGLAQRRPGRLHASHGHQRRGHELIDGAAPLRALRAQRAHELLERARLRCGRVVAQAGAFGNGVQDGPHERHGGVRRAHGAVGALRPGRALRAGDPFRCAADEHGLRRRGGSGRGGRTDQPGADDARRLGLDAARRERHAETDLGGGCSLRRGRRRDGRGARGRRRARLRGRAAVGGGQRARAAGSSGRRVRGMGFQRFDRLHPVRGRARVVDEDRFDLGRDPKRRAVAVEPPGHLGAGEKHGVRRGATLPGRAAVRA